MTTREPGASEVLTAGGATVRPCSTAFFASRPAASSTAGFHVFVHEVIGGDQHVAVADVERRRASARRAARARPALFAKPFSATGFANSVVNACFMPELDAVLRALGAPRARA